MAEPEEFSVYAFCLVCKEELREPFLESEVLISRNALLAQTFCEHVEVDGDCEIISKEFPFCGACKLALVELKGLDVEVATLVRRTSSITNKLIAKILETEEAKRISREELHNPYTSKHKIISSQKELLEDRLHLKFSDRTYKHVKHLRNSLFRRYDAKVALQEGDVPVLTPWLFQQHKEEPEDSDAQSWTFYDDTNDFNTNAGSDAEIEEGEEQDVTSSYEHEQSPQIEHDRSAGEVAGTSTRCMRNTLTGNLANGSSVTWNERSKLCDPLSPSDACEGNFSDSEGSPNKGSSGPSDEGDGDSVHSPGRVLRNRVIVGDNSSVAKNNESRASTESSSNLATKKEDKVRTFCSDRRYKEVSPGKWLYDGRFTFEKDGTVFRCTSGSCVDATFRDLRSIVNHVRKYHYLHPSTRRAIFRLREVAPNQFLYGGKYKINFVEGKYVCSLCGTSRVTKNKTCEHIRKYHITNGHTELRDFRSRRRYEEVNPGKWLYDGRFTFEKDGTAFRCTSGSCVDAIFRDLRSIVNHVRKYHYLRPSTKPAVYRLREVAPNKFLYGGKYLIDLVEGNYICNLCGTSRTTKVKICEHIRKCHIANGQSPPNGDPLSHGSACDRIDSDEHSTAVNIIPVKIGLSEEVSPGRWLYRKRYPFEKIEHRFHCGSCSENFPEFRKIVSHVRNVHFRNRDRVRRRLSLVEVEPNKFMYGSEFRVDFTEGIWKCVTCEYNTTEKKNMHEHLRSNHNEKYSYICDVCGKVFGRKDSFQKHKTIHDPERMDVICHVCGKSFKSDQGLKKHVSLHETS